METNLIIITGVPGVGKTSIAKALQKKISNSIYIEGDNLKRKLQKQFSKTEYPYLHTSSTEAWKILGEKNRHNIVNGMKSYRNVVEKKISGHISNLLKKGNIVILEGAQISPKFNVGGVKNKVHFLLIQPDIKVHKLRFLKNRLSPFILKVSRSLAEKYKHSRILQEYLMKEAETNNVNMITNNDKKDTLQEILETIN